MGANIIMIVFTGRHACEENILVYEGYKKGKGLPPCSSSLPRSMETKRCGDKPRSMGGARALLFCVFENHTTALTYMYMRAATG